jgi:hypothetical protein
MQISVYDLRIKNKQSNITEVENQKKTFMKASNEFKKTIKAHLEKRATEDELFAVTYKKENKNLDECCNYVMECAKKGGCAGYSDDEVFGWAVHYYDEDDIKNIKPISGKVIVNHSVELTEDDKKISQRKNNALLIEESKIKTKLFLKQLNYLKRDMQSQKKQAMQR